MNLTTKQVELIVRNIREVAEVLEEGLKHQVDNEEASVEKTEKKATKETVVKETTKPAKETKGKTSKATKVEQEEIEEEESEEEEEVTKESLEAMTFNELKAYAKSIDVKAVGTKKTIIENILQSLGTNEEDEGNSEVEDEDEEETGNNEEPTLYDKVEADLEEYSDEELADILSEVGISPKGKRQALLAKIVDAIESGKLEWESEEEENEDSSDEEEEEEEEATPERQAQMDSEEDDIRKAYKNKELSDKEIADFLKDYYNGEYKGSKKENLENYIKIMTSLVDDEGEVHDFEEPYYVGEEVLCCGENVKTLDNGNMFCEKCGNEYENE